LKKEKTKKMMISESLCSQTDSIEDKRSLSEKDLMTKAKRISQMMLSVVTRFKQDTVFNSINIQI